MAIAVTESAQVRDGLVGRERDLAVPTVFVAPSVVPTGHISVGLKASRYSRAIRPAGREPTDRGRAPWRSSRPRSMSRELAIARTARTPLAAMPTQRAAMLLAKLEELEQGNEGRAAANGRKSYNVPAISIKARSRVSLSKPPDHGGLLVGSGMVFAIDHRRRRLEGVSRGAPCFA
jgi:hypothetical protein